MPNEPHALRADRMVLVTGATGLVGRHAVAALRAHGCRVVAVGRGSVAAARTLPADVRHIAADVLDQVRHARLFEAAGRDGTPPDTVLHLAWTTAHGSFWSDAANRDWSAATLNLARAAAAAGVRRFVGVGTCVEYGASRSDPCREADAAQATPHTLYGEAKAETARGLAEIAEATGLAVAWARLFHVTGPGEPPAKLLSHVVAQVLACRSPELRDPGRHVDLVDCRNAGEATGMLALSDVCGAVNIGTGRATRVGDLPEIVAAALAGRMPEVAAAPPPYDGLVADIGRMRNLLGFTPRLDLAASVRDIAASLPRPPLASRVGP